MFGKKKKKAVYDKDLAEKRGVDELFHRCTYSLKGRELRKAQSMRDKCLRGLYMLLENNDLGPLPETWREWLMRWIRRGKD